MEAQVSPVLPKVTPSHTEDFSDYKSHLGLCVKDVFFDDNGKMWLNLCNNVNALNLHLLQFDGYSFQLVEGDLKKLSAQNSIHGMLNGHTLIGHSNNEDEGGHIFRYDLHRNELRYHYPPKRGRVKFVAVKESEQVSFLHISEQEWTIYEMADTQFIELVRIKSDSQQMPRFFDGDLLWTTPIDLSYLEQVDVNTGQREKYHLPALEYIKPDPKAHPALIFLDITTANGITYFSFRMQGRHYLLKTTNGERRLTFVDDGKSQNQTRRHWDKQGNTLTVYTYTGKRHQAVLEDSDGNRFDYTSFFETLAGTQIHKIVGSDYKQQLIICHSNGILLHKVKSFNAIQSLGAAINARAIVEIAAQQYLVAVEKPDRFIINSRTNQSSILEMPACHFQERTLVQDEEGNIWAAAKTEGLVKFNPLTHSCQQIPTSGKRIHFYFAFVSASEIALITSDKTLEIHDLESGMTTPFLMDDEPYTFASNIQDMLFGQNNLLWIATVSGLHKIDLKAGIVEVLGHGAPFDNPRFLCIDEDAEGRIWLGTSVHGLQIYNPETQTLKTLNSDRGLANNTVVSITPDDEGDRWLGTYNGISLVSSEGDLITNLYENDGVVHRESNRYSNLKTTDGNILIGTLRGISFVDSKAIKENLTTPYELQIYLTDLEYFDTQHGKPEKHIYGLTRNETVHLPAAHRNLVLGFAVSNYFKPEENKYAYRLNEEAWIDLGNQANLRLSNLPAGDHTLSIRGSDRLGNWTKDPLTININSAEAFYKQSWFFALCLFLTGCLVALWINSLRTQVKLATSKIRNDKKIIEQQADKLRELDQAKSRFFTNISHEFRTPLTIISGMIDQVVAKPDTWLERGGKMIKQNTLSLLNLINQILDLRKLESQKLTLNLVQGDIVIYLRYLTESFQSYAENKGLKLHFLAAQPSVIMDYDPDKILRIVSNLLSNAIKYNKEQGDVYFQIDQIENGGKDYLQMRVQDTGKGIPKEKLPDVFGRFFQINEPGKEKVVGSGIGLALTHELVTLMGGTIEVDSEVNVSTTFLLKIPITQKAEMKDSFLEMPAAKQAITSHSNVDVPKQTHRTRLITNKINDADFPRLLVVEDNMQIVQILEACLGEDYYLTVAHNGQQGIDMAIEQVPDIIVSDVMMPLKDGFELTDTLKNDERTSHIPIILLTAKTDMDSKISGLEKGADAYLAKPFEQRELLVRLKKLLQLRMLLQVRYSGLHPAPDGQAPSEELQMEDLFIQKVRGFIAENLSNSEYDILRLTRDLGMSRSQLFRKIKALTGTTPALFIRSQRLQESRNLLTTTDLTISEIAYEVGFSTIQYFSDAFLEEFGERPSATRK